MRSMLLEEGGGKKSKLNFFRANLCANICIELAYDFYDEIYSDQVNIVSFIIPKRLGEAGVKVEVGGLSALHSNWSEVGYLSFFLCIFNCFWVSIHVFPVCCRQEVADAYRLCFALGHRFYDAFARIH